MPELYLYKSNDKDLEYLINRKKYTSLELNDSRIKRIVFPKDCKISDIKISSEKDITYISEFPKIGRLEIYWSKINCNFPKLPDCLNYLLIRNTNITPFPKTFPSSLTYLCLEDVDIDIFPDFPETLEEICLTNIKNLNILPKLPDNLKKLSLFLGISLIEFPEKLPNNLTRLTMMCKIKNFRLHSLPPNLNFLDISYKSVLFKLPDFFPDKLKFINIYVDQNCEIPRLPKFSDFVSIKTNKGKLLKHSPKLPEKMNTFCIDCERIYRLRNVISLYVDKNTVIFSKIPKSLRYFNVWDLPNFYINIRLKHYLKIVKRNEKEDDDYYSEEEYDERKSLFRINTNNLTSNKIIRTIKFSKKRNRYINNVYNLIDHWNLNPYHPKLIVFCVYLKMMTTSS
ncbi:MAG TPA: hypothetical protein V6C58_17430 [Allocoleopsis sp.]